MEYNKIKNAPFFDTCVTKNAIQVPKILDFLFQKYLRTCRTYDII